MYDIKKLSRPARKKLRRKRQEQIALLVLERIYKHYLAGNSMKDCVDMGNRMFNSLIEDDPCRQKMYERAAEIVQAGIGKMVARQVSKQFGGNANINIKEGIKDVGKKE